MGKVLSSHFDTARKRLTADGEIAKPFHHKTNKGSIREVFVRELLNNSTSQFCSVGSGEIIHRDMEDDEERNQIDVVLYNNRFPKVAGANGIDLFFVETVSSFIEVKSLLTKGCIRQAAQAAKRIKTYPNAPPQRSNPTGTVKTPRPYSFLFAYDTRANDIAAALEWMKEVVEEDDYNLDALRTTAPSERSFFPHYFLDGVFVLNKGYVAIDALPLQSPMAAQPDTPRDCIWLSSPEAELEYLWAIINIASEKLLWNEFKLGEYLPVRMVAVSD